MYSATTFFVAWVVASDGRLVALVFNKLSYSQKNIMASLEGRDGCISATLAGDTIRDNASPLTSYSSPSGSNPPPPPSK